MNSQAEIRSIFVLLGVDLDELNQIEKKVLRLEQAVNEDDIDERAGSLAEAIEKLFASQFNKMAAISVQQRSKFYKYFMQRLESQQCHTSIQQNSKLNTQLHCLDLFCGIDFTRKPLSFVPDALKQWRIWEPDADKLLDLIKAIRNKADAQSVFVEEDEELSKRRANIVLTCMGRLKSGKSSFINYLLERNVCPVGNEATTARLTMIRYGEQTSVELCAADGTRKDYIIIRDDTHLAETTRNLIHLKGNDRKNKNLCTDKIIIELQMEVLKHIQLWDIPGVDENDTLNQIVDDILADSDIIFAITPLTGGLPDSFLTPIKRLLRPTQDELVERVLTAQDTLVINSSPPKKHAEICFLISKIDDIMRDMNSRLCYQNTLNHLFFEIKTKLNLDLGDNTESSYQFIPICTRRQSDSMTAFLYGYRSFIEKSRKYFADAVIDITEGRLNYLTRVLHAMFDCDDYRRAVEQADKLYTLFKSGVHNLENEIKCELKEVFDIMCAIIQANLMDLEAKAFVAINDATRKAEINRKVRAMLMDQFKREIETNENEIRKRLARCVAKFFSNMDMNPRHIQLLEEVHQKLITSNPYSVALGQYDARFGQLCAATVENVARSYSDKSSTFELRLRKMGFYAYMSLAILVDPKQAVLIKMEDLVEKGASDTCEYLKEMLMAEVMEKIRSRIYSILMKFEKNPFYYKIQHAREVSNYLSINKHEVTRVYLNILDKKFRLTYPECNVGNAELDRSNSPVYMGYLKHNGENKNIAAKVISLDDFNLQEVRYLDELSHENIPHYYGVRKKDDNADHYEIIMERLDSNLKEYLKWKKAKKELSDRDINFILLQVVQGLAYMHKSGFFHRDIKPHNILVKMNEPLPPRCLIADFGFIHRVPNSVRGTLNYLAPELLEANTDNKPFITMKTDVYALGVTIRDIINTSHIRKQEQFITFWTGIYKQCLQKEPADRPSCSDIIEQHHRLTAC